MVNGHLQSERRAALLEAPIEPSVYAALLGRRRSIRRLRHCELDTETLERVQEAILRTPSAYGVPVWHVVLVHQRRAAFWEEVELGFRASLSGDRLDRYLDRLQGFREAAAVALIYEDRDALPELRDAWNLSEETAHSFVQQGLGMVQLAIWLAVTAEGLATSLQHWDWLIQDRIAGFVDLPGERFHLAATMPIGLPAEEPRQATPIDRHRLLSLDREPRVVVCGS
jgi:predicted oxidoreductase (fatty acid repression mutant protein)